MSNIIGEKTREQIAKFLPDAIARALTDYQRFSEKAHTESAEFAKHHSACKTALGHVELLLKLAKELELPDARVGDPNAQIILATLMQEAREELKGFDAQDG